MSDEELIDEVRTSRGLVSIGLKPIAATRTSVSGVLPAITAAENLAARALLEQHGVQILRSYRNIAAVAARIDADAAPAIRNLPVVNYLESEVVGSLQAQDTSWGMKKIAAQLAWSSGQRGQSSHVTMIDAGLDLTHISSGDGPAGFLGDCYFTVTGTCYWTATAHGVLVAGVIAGRDNDLGYIGAANQLGSFASIKVVDNNFQISAFDVTAALDWATSSGYPRHVVNMSLGFCTPSQALYDAILRAANAGILMVAAAGNTNENCADPLGLTGVMYPARYDEVIGVSGTTEDDTFWFGPRSPCGTVGSRYGLGVDLSAPFWSYSMIGNGEYHFDCWTSYAAATVTGVAALAWTKYPTMTVAQLTQHLRVSVIDLGPNGWDQHFGFGRINAAAAVGYQPPPPPHTVTITGPTEISASTGCSWYAGVVGGTAPFSYAWSVNDQSVGPDAPELWYENDGSPFTLQVTVTDAGGSGAIDDHEVSIDPNAYCL
ncbi:MAG: S8 family peptidase [Gemmatimonadaceae bacterium]